MAERVGRQAATARLAPRLVGGRMLLHSHVFVLAAGVVLVFLGFVRIYLMRL
jgi:hypothetical protein